MNKEAIFNLIVHHICDIVPELKGHPFQASDQLKELGANSVDRAEIIALTLESLSLRIPLSEVFGAQNLDELAEMLHEKVQSA
jgi:polyketide biosynthesis acyl carrier protein